MFANLTVGFRQVLHRLRYVMAGVMLLIHFNSITQSVCFDEVFNTINTGGCGGEGKRTADFNNDGNMDIAATRRSKPAPSLCYWGVSVWLGNGDGSFQDRVDYAVPSNHWYLAVADFNEDGNIDIATSGISTDTAIPGHVVSILFGNGDGTFQDPVVIPVPSGDKGVIFSDDLNDDGHADLVICHFWGSQIAIMLGDGTGSFSISHFYAGRNIVDAAVADFNEDGHNDLIVSGAYIDSVYVLFGDGQGDFSIRTPLYTGIPGVPPYENNPNRVTAADFDRDGHMDFALGLRGGFPERHDSMAIWLGNGDGTFQQPSKFDAGGWVYDLKTVDINRDSIPDIFAKQIYSARISVHLGNGDGTFVFAGKWGGGGSGPMDTADFNNDGWLDAVSATLYMNCSGGTFIESTLSDKALMLTVLPNPASGFVAVEIQGYETATLPACLSFYNTLGEQIKGVQITDDNMLIDVSDLAGGLYLLQARDQKHALAAGKLMIIRE